MAATFKHPKTGVTCAKVISWSAPYDEGRVKVGVSADDEYVFLFNGNAPKSHKEWRHVAEVLARYLCEYMQTMGGYGEAAQASTMSWPYPTLTREAMQKQTEADHVHDQLELPL